MFGLPRQNIAAHQGASRTPPRSGGFALLGCSTNSACQSVMDSLSDLTPPKINKQHIPHSADPASDFRCLHAAIARRVWAGRNQEVHGC